MKPNTWKQKLERVETYSSGIKEMYEVTFKACITKQQLQVIMRLSDGHNVEVGAQ